MQWGAFSLLSSFSSRSRPLSCIGSVCLVHAGFEPSPLPCMLLASKRLFSLILSSETQILSPGDRKSVLEDRISVPSRTESVLEDRGSCPWFLSLAHRCMPSCSTTCCATPHRPRLPLTASREYRRWSSASHLTAHTHQRQPEPPRCPSYISPWAAHPIRRRGSAEVRKS